MLIHLKLCRFFWHSHKNNLFLILSIGYIFKTHGVLHIFIRMPNSDKLYFVIFTRQKTLFGYDNSSDRGGVRTPVAHTAPHGRFLQRLYSDRSVLTREITHWLLTLPWVAWSMTDRSEGVMWVSRCVDQSWELIKCRSMTWCV